MQPRSLSDWLQWQESLNPAEIELGLDRIRTVADKLELSPPSGNLFIIAGTNGKGSTAAYLNTLLSSAGLKVGVYSSPHLCRYNERVSVAGIAASDAELVAAFAAIEAARGDAPLTFFEYGTLAAAVIFSARNCDAWVLEVGLGGRLDAVNIFDADFCVITTIDFDHQAWLGDSLEEIAAEKVGIARAGKPLFFGDLPVPAAISARATEIDAEFIILEEHYGYRPADAGWSWWGKHMQFNLPGEQNEAQLRNQALALAVMERYDSSLLTQDVVTAMSDTRLPGRMQIIQREHEWVLDVAHNVQAARTLRAGLDALPKVPETTVVVGMLADKQAEEFVNVLQGGVDRWITCTTAGGRGADAEALATQIGADVEAVTAGGSPAEAFAYAQESTPAGGRIVVCGSFTVVGPALDWLGLYSAA